VVACNCLLPLVEGAGDTVGAAVVNNPSCNLRLASDGAGDEEGVVVACNCLAAEPTSTPLKFACATARGGSTVTQKANAQLTRRAANFMLGLTKYDN